MKHKATFSFDCTALVNAQNKSFKELALASDGEDSLMHLFPDNVNLKDNLDIIGFTYPAAVVNAFNKNGQGISTETALSIYKKFNHKPTNIEHDAKKIVGHVVNSFFSSHDGSEILSEENVIDLDHDKFNISLSSVMYATVDTLFTEIALRSSNSNDPLYEFISASWEVMFSDYHIAVGSKNLKDCIIYTDEEDIEKYSKYLLSNKGSGKDPEGNIVSQLIVGEIAPVGIGFTTKPAAEVKGIKSPIWEIPKEDEEPNESNKAEYKEKSKAFEDKISQNKKQSVNQIKVSLNSKKEMDENDTKVLEDIKAFMLEQKSSDKAIASLQKIVQDAIKDGDEKYTSELAAEKKAKASAEQELLDAKTRLSDVEETLSNTKKELDVIKNAESERLAVATFNQRLEKIDDNYDLDEATRKVITDRIKGMDEESFASYEEEISILLAPRSKASIAKAQEDAAEKAKQALLEDQEKSKASENTEEKPKGEEIENLLDKATASEAPVSTPSEPTKTKEDSWNDAFKKGDIEVKF